MRYASERQIIGLDVIVDRHLGELRNQAEMSTNQAFDQAGMRQAVEAAICAVPRRRREHQRKVPRLSGLHEAPLQRLDDLVGRSHADEAGRGDGVTGTDDGHRLCGVDDLVAHQASLPGLASRATSQSAMLWLSLPCDLLETNRPTWPPGSGISVESVLPIFAPSAREQSGGMIWSSSAKTFNTGAVIDFRSTRRPDNSKLPSTRRFSW